MRSLYKEAAFSISKDDPFSVGPPPLPVHLFDLIPRNLKHFESGWPFIHESAPGDRARLPKAIVSLELGSPLPLDKRLLRFLPMIMMTSLQLFIEGMDECAIELLGKRIINFVSFGVEWRTERDGTAMSGNPGLTVGDGTNDFLWNPIQDQQRRAALCAPYSLAAFELFGTRPSP